MFNFLPILSDSKKIGDYAVVLEHFNHIANSYMQIYNFSGDWMLGWKFFLLCLHLRRRFFLQTSTNFCITAWVEENQTKFNKNQIDTKLDKIKQEESSKFKSQTQSQTQTIQVKPRKKESNRAKQDEVESNRVK